MANTRRNTAILQNLYRVLRNRLPLIVVIAAFMVLGTGLALLSRAAGPMASVEVDSGTVAAPASVVSDATASGGKAVKFGPTVSPPATSSIYWGALMSGKPYCGCDTQSAPWITSTWDTFEQHTGKKVSLVNWGQRPPWFEDFATTPFNLVNSRGALSFYHMSTESTRLTEVASGKYDAAIAKWAQAAKAYGHPFLFRFNWEMNGDWFAWGAQAKTNPAIYVASWRHFHDVVAAQGAANVTWVWCPNVLYSGGTPLEQLYPGDAYVDWTCMDGYNWGANPLRPGMSWQSFTQIMQPTYNKLLTIAPNKPIAIAETSSTEIGGSKAAWLDAMLTTELPKNFPKIKAVSWFNWNVNEFGGNWDWPIESSVSAQNAFKNGIASPYYRSNNYGNLPLGKVPIPQ